MPPAWTGEPRPARRPWGPPPCTSSSRAARALRAVLGDQAPRPEVDAVPAAQQGDVVREDELVVRGAVEGDVAGEADGLRGARVVRVHGRGGGDELVFRGGLVHHGRCGQRLGRRGPEAHGERQGEKDGDRSASHGYPDFSGARFAPGRTKLPVNLAEEPYAGRSPRLPSLRPVPSPCRAAAACYAVLYRARGARDVREAVVWRHGNRGSSFRMRMSPA